MLVQDGLPSNAKAVTFPGDTSRTLSFRMFSDPESTSADIVYTIGPETPNVTFAGGSRELQRSGVGVPTGGVNVNTPVSFVKTDSGVVFQIPVTAQATEKGGASSITVDWVIPVVQTGAEKVSFASAGLAKTLNVESGLRDSFDRAELLRAARLLRTLQAAVDAALAADSHAPDAPSEES